MAITFPTNGVGAWAEGTANLTPALPSGVATGDMMLCFYGTKPYSDVPTINNSWNDFGNATNGTTDSGVDTGSMQVRVFWKIHTGSETAPTITNSTNSVSSALIIAFRKTSSNYNWSAIVGAGGGDTSSGTDFSATTGSNFGITANDMVVGYAATPTDAATQSSIGITATDCTIGTITEPVADVATTSGQDMSMSGGYALCTAGTSSAAPVYSSTLASASTGTAYVVRLREAQPVVSQADPGIIAITGRIAIDHEQKWIDWPTAFTLRVFGDWVSSADTGTITINGVETINYRSLLSSCDLGTITITGNETTSTIGYLSLADYGVVTITGTEATSGHEYPSIADSGTIAITGAETTNYRSLLSSCDSGTIAIVGIEATSVHGYPSIADSGTIAITGVETTNYHTFISESNSGTINVTGYEATTYQITYKSEANNGTIAITGYTITPLETGWTDWPTAFTLTVAGNVVSLADVGTIIITGSEITTTIGYLSLTDYGVVTITGIEAITTKHLTQVVAGGMLIGGVAVQLGYTSSYTITGLGGFLTGGTASISQYYNAYQKISQVLAQVEYGVPPCQKISQVLAQVEYSIGLIGSGGSLVGGTGSPFGSGATYSISGIGGGFVGGAATFAANYNAAVLGTGGGFVGGTATFAANYNAAVSGGSLIGGTATFAANFSINGMGGNLIGGTGSPLGTGATYSIIGSAGGCISGFANAFGAYAPLKLYFRYIISDVPNYYILSYDDGNSTTGMYHADTIDDATEIMLGQWGFITGPAIASFSLTAADLSLWLYETANTVNAQGSFRMYKYSNGSEVEIGGGPFLKGSEIPTGPPYSEQTWTGTCTSTNFAKGDRLVIKLFVANIGTMHTGRAYFQIDAAEGNTGDSSTYINETSSAFMVPFYPITTLNTVNGYNFETDTTPTLEFTGVDTYLDKLEYELRIGTDGIYQVDNATSIGSNTLTLGYFFDTGFGEAFVATSKQITGLKFYLQRAGNPPGTIYARLYAASGTYGYDAIPSGGALVECGISSSSIPTELGWVTFTFSTPFTPNAGQIYIAACQYANGVDVSNNFILKTATTHIGNVSNCAYGGSQWGAGYGYYLAFDVIEDSDNLLFTKLSNSHTGFVNTIDAGDTHPFNSGQKISYTVQPAEALTVGLGYKWAVRAISNSKYGWGSFTSIRSFGLNTTYSISGVAGGLIGGTGSPLGFGVSYSISGAGGSLIGGTATFAANYNVMVLGTGGGFVGGTAIIATNFGSVILGSGGGFVGGTATFVANYNAVILGSGGGFVGGTATFAANYNAAVSGGSLIGGTATFAANYNAAVLGTGGNLLGGTAIIATNFGSVVLGSGGGLVGGTAIFERQLNYYITGSNGIICGGNVYFVANAGISSLQIGGTFKHNSVLGQTKKMGVEIDLKCNSVQCTIKTG